MSSFRPGTAERAIELAKSGSCPSFTAIMRRLGREGYHDARAHLDGATIRKQLTELIRSSRPNSVA